MSDSSPSGAQGSGRTGANFCGMGSPGKPTVGIPRWLTGANLIGIALAFTLAIPFGARATVQGPPTNLCVCARINPASGYAPTAAKLTWQDASSATTTQYALQRSTSSAFNASVVEYRIAKNTFEFFDETFTRNGTFYYRIFSYVGADRSATASNTATLVNGSTLGLPSSAPGVPDQLTAEAATNGVRFSWVDHSTTETFFRVERGTAAEGGSANATWEWRGNVLMASGSGSRVGFVDTDPGEGPMYRVTAFNGKGASRSYAFGPYPNVPGVNTSGVQSMVNQVASGVPTNVSSVASPFVSMATGVTSAIPSDINGTINGIVSPLASTASGLTSAVPAASNVVNSVNAIASPWLAVASGLTTLVPSNPATLIPTVDASSAIATATSAIPPVENWKLWIGLRFNFPPAPPSYIFNQWILPTSCLSTSPICNPPASPTFCGPLPFVANLEYCYTLEIPTTR